MDQKKIGKFIATLRKEKRLTQKEIAERLGISEKTISKWECGNGLPEVVYMEPLCEILGITINELLVGEHFCITRNRSIYLEQAQLSAKMLRWFDKHIEELNARLKRLAGGV